MLSLFKKLPILIIIKGAEHPLNLIKILPQSIKILHNCIESYLKGSLDWSINHTPSFPPGLTQIKLPSFIISRVHSFKPILVKRFICYNFYILWSGVITPFMFAIFVIFEVIGGYNRHRNFMFFRSRMSISVHSTVFFSLFSTVSSTCDFVEFLLNSFILHD